MKKYVLGFLLTTCLAVSVTSGTVSAATTMCTTYDGSNVEDQDYSRWATPVTSYLSVCENGSLMRVQYGSSIDGVLLEYNDEEYNLLSTKIIKEELPLFGGFYETDSNYFLLTGQTNEEESEEVEVYRITKYDKNWNRIASAGLYDCNTTVPFDAGSARMDVCGNYLLIRTSHEMYMSSDGLNHQANVTIQLDMDSMCITDSYTGIMNSGYGYVSHSFNQFIKMEGNIIVAVDHGDAYPRSIALVKYQTDVSGGVFTPTYYKQCIVTDVLAFPGSIGQNVTGASVGGFEISDSAYLIAGNSVIQDESNLTRTTRNIFVGSVDKSTSEVTINWITSYEEGDGTTSTPQMVEVADNTYMLLWSRDGNVYYTKIDGTGQQIGEIYSMEGALSDCVPVVNDDKLIWYTWDSEINTFYDISLNDLNQTQTTIIENGHHYENLGVKEGYALLKCTECGEEKELQVATSITPYWRMTASGSYSSASPSSKQLIGNQLYFWIAGIFPSGADSEMEILVSDPEVISYAPSTDGVANGGTLTMLKKGTATVTMRPKYNPDAAVVYTFNVTVNATDDDYCQAFVADFITEPGERIEPSVELFHYTEENPEGIKMEGVSYQIETSDEDTNPVTVDEFGTTVQIAEDVVTQEDDPKEIVLNVVVTATDDNGNEVRSNAEWKILVCKHSYDTITTPSTCTQKGSGVSTCTKCKTQKTEELPLADHTIVTDKAVAATCTTTGKTEGSHCSVCNTVIKAQTIIPAKGHSYETVMLPAATKQNGSIIQKCSVCGTVKDNTTISYPKDITLAKTSYTYNGKSMEPKVTVKDSNGNTIDAQYYSVSYSNNKNVGQATVTITFCGNYSGTVEKTFTIQPKPTSISKLTAKKKGFTVKWKKQSSQTTGYEIQYSTNSKFKSPKTVTIKKNKTTSKSISKLKSKKKYYVRIRTYKTVKIDGKSTKIYSKWSKIKKVRLN